MSSTFEVVVDQVKEIRERLAAAGWVIANAVGEQRTADSVLWFSSTYVHGEYTVTASHRPAGFGKAEGTTRVRLTPALVAHYPHIGADLAKALIEASYITEVESQAPNGDVRGTLEDPEFWPPRYWRDLARG